MNLSERYFHEWAESPDGGCPTLEEYAEAFRELERLADYAARVLAAQQRENYNRAVADATRIRLRSAQYPQYGAQHLQAGGTYLGQVLGRSGFARLLVNAEGQTRVVESYAEEQAAKAEGWRDPNR